MDNSGVLRIDATPPIIGSKGNADHDFLRKCAVRWLTGTKKCSVVLSEMSSAAGEIPDAVGWKYGNSILVECKVSLSDIHANQFKSHIRSEKGVGRFRYLMVPMGLIGVDHFARLGHFKDWGLLYLHENSSVRVRKESESRETDEHREILMLTSALRRVRTREFLTIIQGDGDADQNPA
jgi:hypothetical protein